MHIWKKFLAVGGIAYVLVRKGSCSILMGTAIGIIHTNQGFLGECLLSIMRW